MEAITKRGEITSLLRTVAEESGIRKHVITDVKTNQKGEGYLGEIFMVSIKDANSDQTLEVVLKAAFNEEKVREMVPIRMSFQNEIYFYMEVHPVFEQFEKEQQVNSLQFVPKCLKVRLEEQEEMLVLENLRDTGFEMFDKTLILDEDHVKLIFKTYGRVHGYSFALRDQKPEEYSNITKKFHNVYAKFIEDGFFAEHLTEISQIVQNMFIPGEDDAIIEKYHKYEGGNIANIFNNIVTEDVDHSVILHGDCWSNNMMFKYENSLDGKKPVDMRLIDWQLTKAGSPVCDLSYCLYSGASKRIFDNLNEYLRIYYDSLSAFVRELGSDPERLFPFSVLKEHWRKYAKFGMIMAFAVLKLKLTDKDDLVSLNDGFDKDGLKEAFHNQKFDEENYNKRIRGMLWHMSDLDAL